MSAYILIVVAWWSNAATVTMQEFSSLETCEQAKKTTVTLWRSNFGIDAKCVTK